MKTTQEILDGWARVKTLLDHSENKSLNFTKPKIIETLTRTVSPKFRSVIIDKLDESNKEKLFNELIKIRDIFLKLGFFASNEVVGIDNSEFESIREHLLNIENIFNSIAELDSILDLFKLGDDVVKAQRDEIENELKKLEFIKTSVSTAPKIFNGKKRCLSFFLFIKNTLFYFNLATILFIALLIPGVIKVELFSWIDLSKLSVFQENSYQKIPSYYLQVFYGMITRIFVLFPLIWSALFLSKRISEDRKLEQTYLHKAVVAEAYISYSEYFNAKYSPEDYGEIRNTLSKIAIESLGLNPALLLEKGTAEKIPMEELLSKIIDKAGSNTEKGKG